MASNPKSKKRAVSILQDYLNKNRADRYKAALDSPDTTAIDIQMHAPEASAPAYKPTNINEIMAKHGLDENSLSKLLEDVLAKKAAREGAEPPDAGLEGKTLGQIADPSGKRYPSASMDSEEPMMDEEGEDMKRMRARFKRLSQ